MKKYLLILLLASAGTSFHTNLFAHEFDDSKGDFIVSNNNDTLYGKFKKKLFDQATFIVNGEKIPLDPTQYSTYSFKHSLFRSIQLSPNTNPQWMECLENGTICLYQYVMLQNTRPGQPPTSRVIWLAQKNGGQILNVNGVMSSEDVAKSNMSALLADKPDLQNDFLEGPLNTKSIQYFIQQYNKGK